MSSGSLLLFDLQSAINIGMLLRVGEVYQRTVLIHDPRSVLARDDARKTISDFAVGALQRRPPTPVSADMAQLKARSGGRLVAADAAPGARNSMTFDWRADDCIVLGNEYDGLPAHVLGAVDAIVTIPMPPGYYPKPTSSSPIDPARARTVSNDGAPSLNVATAGAVLCSVAYARTSGLLGTS